MTGWWILDEKTVSISFEINVMNMFTNNYSTDLHEVYQIMSLNLDVMYYAGSLFRC